MENLEAFRSNSCILNCDRFSAGSQGKFSKKCGLGKEIDGPNQVYVFYALGKLYGVSSRPAAGLDAKAATILGFT